MFSFLRSVFVAHVWNEPAGSTVRSCRVCGRREEMAGDDWNLNAWAVTWEGYPKAHTAKSKPSNSPVATRPIPISADPLSGQDQVITG
jgi:hypothetical protein